MSDTAFIDEIAPEPVEEPTEEPQAAEPVAEPITEPEATEPASEPAGEPKTVPLAALLEERGKYRDELAKSNERVAKMEALFERFQTELTPKAEPEAQIPAYEEDPDGHFRASMDAMQKRLDGFDSQNADRLKQDGVSAEQQQFLNNYAASARAFTVKTPDFDAAYAHLAQSVDAELIARGFDDPTERANVLRYEEGELVGRAMRAGKDPAEVLYAYAKHRGYAPDTAKTNGADEEADKLTRLKAGANAAKSLSGPGANSEAALTLESLVELADTDGPAFDRAFEKARQKGMLG